ncbi:hypothetical protein B6N60_03456 [Richelia sinica FACHB-800]|uniref:DUF2993 domain-containing protein n=1 Tax=Richelia sinica FACHB-800 TaxID=1357546 RepID=A0A975Y5Z8_9NOST|nr:DUF2993 domain-containing protein [Richelia sinica]MBD2666961.1 DUF2993 domain-containing protein [Richelia sinica FACHB-800]QXE24748.1 hypothetical protein B6N60_03456 [Richelia sinica FACHB-800]
MPESPGIGEQALNKVAEMGISSQLDAVENLDVNIKAEPLKLVQGEVEAVSIAGEGLVMQKDLRMAEMDMQINNVAINPLSVALGKIELTKPAMGKARVVLTAADINRAFNSEYVRNQLQNQQILINGQTTKISPEHVNFDLPGNGKVSIDASVLVVDTGVVEKVAFSAVPEISADGKTVYLKDVESSQNQEVSPQLTQALIDATSEILDLSNFDLEGMSLRVNQLEVDTGKLTLQAAADVAQIPTA